MQVIAKNSEAMKPHVIPPLKSISRDKSTKLCCQKFAVQAAPFVLSVLMLVVFFIHDDHDQFGHKQM